MSVITIHEPWCEQQQQDYNLLIRAIDDLCAATVSFTTNGAQGYQNFIDCRENFQQMFKSMVGRYRYVE